MRARTSDFLLLATVSLWALNFTVSKYILENGFHPLAYASVRYALAGAVFLLVTLPWERSVAIAGEDLPLVALCVVLLLVNQVGFVYALKLTSAATTALLFGSVPIFAALIAFALGMERLSARFWVASLVSFAGVALVASGEPGGVSSNLGGLLLALMSAATWGAYSVAISALMRRYSPFRLSAVILLAFAVLMGLIGGAQLGRQTPALGGLVWLAVLFAVLGPLVITNVTWFTAIDMVGPARATLYANLQPFLAALAALAILSERITGLQVAGGVAIGAGILLARRRAAPPAPE